MFKARRPNLTIRPAIARLSEFICRFWQVRIPRANPLSKSLCSKGYWDFSRIQESLMVACDGWCHVVLFIRGHAGIATFFESCGSPFLAVCRLQSPLGLDSKLNLLEPLQESLYGGVVNHRPALILALSFSFVSASGVKYKRRTNLQPCDRLSRRESAGSALRRSQSPLSRTTELYGLRVSVSRTLNVTCRNRRQHLPPGLCFQANHRDRFDVTGRPGSGRIRHASQRLSAARKTARLRRVR